MSELLDKIKKDVFAKRPVLLEIYNSHGAETLKDYVQKSWRVSSSPADPVFLGLLEESLSIVHGANIASEIKNQLSKKPLVSTVDHHGIWGHPIFVNSDLIYSLHFKPEEFALALSTESVSLNNTSSWSGSLLCHHDGSLKRHSFFKDALKTLPVFSTPSVSVKDISRFKKGLDNKLQELVSVLALDKNSEFSFSQQASIATSNFWQGVFPSGPKLLYLPLESLILKYFLRLFDNPNSFITKIVLTSEARGLWKKYFSDDHTFLFWGIDAKGRRKILTELPESSKEIILLIQEKKIYPSSPLCFAALLNAGMVCVGGFTQTTWLTEVKRKLIKLLQELGEGQDLIENISTKNFAESSLAWLKIGNEYKTPTGTDLFLTGQDLYPKYVKQASRLTLKDSLDLAMPVIYSVVVPKAEQIKDFSADSEQQKMLKSLGIF
jgi:hypothetical protein